MTDRITTIALAIKNEAREMDYYLNEAERSNNPVTKVLFKNLAADEREHVRKIEMLHQKLVNDGTWPEDVPIEVAGTNVVEALDVLGRDLESTRNHNDDDIKALNRAAEVEKEGKALYERLAASAETEAERTFFLFLAKIEDQHLKSVVDSLLYLEDPEGWYASKGCGC